MGCAARPSCVMFSTSRSLSCAAINPFTSGIVKRCSGDIHDSPNVGMSDALGLGPIVGPCGFFVASGSCPLFAAIGSKISAALLEGGVAAAICCGSGIRDSVFLPSTCRHLPVGELLQFFKRHFVSVLLSWFGWRGRRSYPVMRSDGRCLPCPLLRWSCRNPLRFGPRLGLGLTLERKRSVLLQQVVHPGETFGCYWNF